MRQILGGETELENALDSAVETTSLVESAIEAQAIPEPLQDPLTAKESVDRIAETLTKMVDGTLAHLPLIIAGLLVVLVTLGLAIIARRLSKRLLVKAKLRDSLKQLIARFIVGAVWALGLLLAATVVFPDLTPTKALAALGIGSIAIGLAFKDIFENFFAGVLILWKFPFESGDWITCDDITGQVIDVTIRNTILRTVHGELVLIPNADIYKNPVEVLTNLPERRVEVICGIAYGEDVKTARRVISQAVSSCATVAKHRGVQVFTHEFSSSSVDFEVTWWTGSTPSKRRESRDEVLDAVKSALDGAGIEIPFPQRTLWFRDALRTQPAGDEASEA